MKRPVPRPAVHGGARRNRVFDRRLQHERTTLTWERTGLSLMVAGALLVQAGEPPFDDVRHLPGYLAIGSGAALVWWAVYRHELREDSLRRGDAAVSVHPRLVRLVGVFTVALSLASLVVVLTS